MVRPRSPVAFLLVAVVLTSGIALFAWSRGSNVSVPTTVVQKGSFVDYLPVRGEIRPVRSVVLTAPSSGADLQILQLATNGAAVSPGEVVIQFDSTIQQRTLDQRRSELKQAESEIDKAETDGRQRVQAVEAELSQARSAAERARLDIARTELVSKVEAEKLGLLRTPSVSSTR